MYGMDPETVIRRRLEELGLTAYKLEKRRLFSRDTLQNIYDRKPVRPSTLARLESVLEWEPGSAKGLVEGGESPRPRAPKRQSPVERLAVEDLADLKQAAAVLDGLAKSQAPVSPEFITTPASVVWHFAHRLQRAVEDLSAESP